MRICPSLIAPPLYARTTAGSNIVILTGAGVSAFQRYAAGKWLDTHDIPADKSQNGVGSEVSDRAQLLLVAVGDFRADAVLRLVGGDVVRVEPLAGGVALEGRNPGAGQDHDVATRRRPSIERRRDERRANPHRYRRLDLSAVARRLLSRQAAAIERARICVAR